MMNYTSKLEDTIFCNKRNIHNLGGWDPNGGIVGSSSSNYLTFEDYHSYTDLICNANDKFSLSNTNAMLTYPVGLLTLPEVKLLNNSNIQKTGGTYWLNSAQIFNAKTADGYYVDSSGGANLSPVSSFNGVRPVISLKPGTEYASGSGSMADPYVVQ